MDTISSCGAFSLIDQPTRVANTSKTIIDSTVSNDVTSLIHPIIYLSDLNDHYPVACLISRNNCKIKTLKRKFDYYYRDTKLFDVECINSDLQTSLESAVNPSAILTAPETVEPHFKKFINLSTSV